MDKYILRFLRNYCKSRWYSFKRLWLGFGSIAPIVFGFSATSYYNELNLLTPELRRAKRLEYGNITAMSVVSFFGGALGMFGGPIGVIAGAYVESKIGDFVYDVTVYNYYKIRGYW